MIKEIVKTLPQKYGRYFLSMEAPGDEEIPEVKSNTKVIDVKPNNRRRIDFTDGAEEVEEEIPEPSEEEPINQNDDLDYSDNQDYNQDEDTIPEEQQNEVDGTINTDQPEVIDNTDNSVDVDPNEPDISGGEDFNQDVNTQDDGSTDTTPSVDGEDTEINMEDPNGPDISGGEEDFNDGAEDMGEQPIDAQDPQSNDVKKGPGLEYDSTRKYNLFENYLSLSNAINNYITKLENNMGDNQNENQIIKKATEKLREIYSLCYDFMTMKFEISSYVQSLLFFQNLVIMVQMVFDLLKKLNKNNNK